jgi:hypothetical protein
MALEMLMFFFWVVTPCVLVHRDSMSLQNIGIYLQDHMVLQRRRLTLTDITWSRVVAGIKE